MDRKRWRYSLVFLFLFLLSVIGFAGSRIDGEINLNASSGVLTIAGTDAGEEDVTYDFNSVANTIGVGTSTGVTGWAWSRFNFSNLGNLALNTGKNFIIGSTQWNLGDKIEGMSIGARVYGDVTVNAGGTWTVNGVQPNAVTLGTETQGNYVADIVGGTGIDSTGATTGETISHTLSFDPTEITGPTTWGDSNDSIVWTWNVLTGTDPTMTFGNGDITINSTFGSGAITSSGASTFNSGSVDADFTVNWNTGVGLFVQGSDGSVGIGTSSPGDKLHVLDTRTDNESAALYIQQTGVNANGTIYGAFIEKTGACRTNVGGYFSATGAANNYGLIVSDGRVGIGTTSPSSIFHIKASVPGTVGDDYAGQLIIQSPSNDINTSVVITGYKADVNGDPDVQLWYLGSSSSGNQDIIFLNRRNAKLALGTNDTHRLTILGNGNVGINVTDPDAKLEVVGTLHISDAATFDGDAIIGDTLTVNNDGGDDEGILVKGGGSLSPTVNNRPGWIGFGREPSSIVGYMYATNNRLNFDASKPTEGVDVGSINFNLNSGLISCGDLTFNAANPDILNFDADGVLSISGGIINTIGGNIKLYGGSHASKASDIELYSDGTLVLSYDADEANWDFDGENVIGVGTFNSGAITATSVRADGGMGVGTAPESGACYICGGTVTESTVAFKAQITMDGADAASGIQGASFSCGIAGLAGDNNYNILIGTSSNILTTSSYTGTISNATGFRTSFNLARIFSTGATVTDYKGVWVETPTLSGTGTSIVTGIGVHIGDMTSARIGTAWAIFSEGGDSYHVGDLAFRMTTKVNRIGSDTDTTLDLYADTSIDLHADVIMSGDTYWVGAGTGLLYGNMDQDGGTFDVTLTDINTLYELDAATTHISAGPLNDVTFDGDHFLKVHTAGVYFITYSLIAQVSALTGGSEHIEFEILKNGGAVGKGETHIDFKNTVRELPAGSNTLIALAVNDEISIGATAVDSSGKTITIDHLEMSLFMLGGT